ncbi:cbb3-type cytochrome c oxidase subunit II [Roseateles sp. BYS180W]|uniref:Cbb3-type cytochrome c oxidase subunit II n=1 Tax=Roseateles rivi TaxID=3299028 RepID=A0ABW7FRP2_9BURK
MLTDIKLLGGAAATLGLATAALVVLPYMQVRDVQALPGSRPYTEQELRGRAVYIANGCVYCHTQQPRARHQAPDTERGWGRASVPADYVYDSPHLLGTMRTGPDLFNIGVRQPSQDWHLGHLYQPRAFVAASNMPAYPYLFTLKPKAQEGDVVVNLPPAHQPDQQVVVARPEALDLVRYLQALKHDQPVLQDPPPSTKTSQAR